MERINKMKKALEELIGEDYPTFIKAIVSIEKGIDDKETLDYIYDRYLEEDFNILNDEIDFLKERVSEMKKYDNEKLVSKLENLTGNYLNYEFDEPITLSELEKTLGVEVNKNQWNNNKRFNEYETEYVTVTIETFDKENKEHINVGLVLEVNEDDKITQIVNYETQLVDYEENLEMDEIEDEWDLEM